MDFGFSEEQEMLRDAAKRFLADTCSTKFVRQMMADGAGTTPASGANWSVSDGPDC